MPLRSNLILLCPQFIFKLVSLTFHFCVWILISHWSSWTECLWVFLPQQTKPDQNHYVLGWSFQFDGLGSWIVVSRTDSGGNNSHFHHFMEKQEGQGHRDSWRLGNWFWMSWFSYRELSVASNGFTEREILGKRGFWEVYKGVLPMSNTLAAVKRISHNSKQRITEFIGGDWQNWSAATSQIWFGFLVTV